ncbi:hypothetical protein [Acidisphaera sp. L21]|uniref:hypothetical protein n=1 Tax=Acidisphaera sp. L21 TaxID=1641851 RepID=UPI00131E1609|nr:hypothetical protein [Acidisphaera sp. L21]
MSDATSRKQTPWEESNDDVIRRHRRARASQPNWADTIVGLIITGVALAVLFNF